VKLGDTQVKALANHTTAEEDLELLAWLSGRSMAKDG